MKSAVTPLKSSEWNLDLRPQVLAETQKYIDSNPSGPILTMASDLMLPGQPITLPRGPVPQLGGGTYSRDGEVRASLVGVPRYEGSVGFHFFFMLSTQLE